MLLYVNSEAVETIIRSVSYLKFRAPTSSMGRPLITKNTRILVVSLFALCDAKSADRAVSGYESIVARLPRA